jgi:hypothetical protein
MVVEGALEVATIDGVVATVLRGSGEQLGLTRAQCVEGDGRGDRGERGEATGVEN